MEKRTAGILLFAATLAPVMVLGAYQMRHSQRYEWEMQDPVDDPPGCRQTSRVHVRQAALPLRRRLVLVEGVSGGSSWGVDSNRADRLFEVAIKRLTLVDTKSVEEVIDIDDGPMFDYPSLYWLGGAGWRTSARSQGKHLREYIDRGGFLMVDDFHGGYEWDNFMAGPAAGLSLSAGGRYSARSPGVPYCWRPPTRRSRCPALSTCGAA